MKNVYFIGIGGIGMSAIARYYHHAGYQVSGYDKTPSRLTRELEAEGIAIHYTDDPALVPPDKTGTLVIYTPAVPKEMQELAFVQKEEYRLIKRSRALGEIASGQYTLAVAGTHGKTTTSTLIAHIYTHSQTGCSAFLGGVSKNYHTNLILSKNPILVTEADEFDRSFLQLFPDIAVITSTDADHLDIYGDLETLRAAFAEFAGQIKPSGYLVMKKNIALNTQNVQATVFTYSFKESADFYPEHTEILPGGYFKFDLHYPAHTPAGRPAVPAGTIEECVMGVPGWINAENGIAAAASALLGGVAPEKIKAALAAFSGVERRLDLHLNTPHLSYIDDYAHHPNEISSAISSIRNMFPGRKLCGIFQPHLYTRTRDFADDFAKSLSSLDELVLLDIYPARELPIPGITAQIIFDKVTLPNKVQIKKEELLDYLNHKELDILITFGAGDVDRFIAPITDMLKKRVENK